MRVFWNCFRGPMIKMLLLTQRNAFLSSILNVLAIWSTATASNRILDGFCFDASLPKNSLELRYLSDALQHYTAVTAVSSSASTSWSCYAWDFALSFCAAWWDTLSCVLAETNDKCWFTEPWSITNKACYPTAIRLLTAPSTALPTFMAPGRSAPLCANTQIYRASKLTWISPRRIASSDGTLGPENLFTRNSTLPRSSARRPISTLNWALSKQLASSRPTDCGFNSPVREN